MNPPSKKQQALIEGQIKKVWTTVRKEETKQKRLGIYRCSLLEAYEMGFSAGVAESALRFIHAYNTLKGKKP